jgi:ceramide kinase
VAQVNKCKSLLLVDLHNALILGKGRFEEANISVKTIYTERANHARDYINEQSLDNYDGLISVGGDGMFSELCHSLLLKTVQQAGLDINDSNVHLIRPNLRIGVIPAGSTDAVAFGTTGHNDPITNALQIIVGESLLIDIATVGIFISSINQTKLCILGA